MTPLRYVCDVTFQKSSPSNQPYIIVPCDRDVVAGTMDVECYVPAHCDGNFVNTCYLRIGKNLDEELIDGDVLLLSPSPASDWYCEKFRGQIETTAYLDDVYELRVEAYYGTSNPIVSGIIKIALVNRLRQSIVDYARGQTGHYYKFAGHGQTRKSATIVYNGSTIGVHEARETTWNNSGPPGACPNDCSNKNSDHCERHSQFLYRTANATGNYVYWESCRGVDINNLGSSQCINRRHFDCVGLVCESYKNAGFGLGHIWTVPQMRTYIHPIQRVKLQSGDLMFWGDHHVGIFAGGAGGVATETVIESRSHQYGVQENNMNTRRPDSYGRVKNEYWLKALKKSW